MRDRILVGIPAIALILFALFETLTGGTVFLALLLIVTYLCSVEYFALVGNHVTPWGRWLGTFFSVVFIAAAYLAPLSSRGFVLLLATFLFCFLLVFLEQTTRETFKDAPAQVALALLPVFYIGFGFGSLLFLKSIPHKGPFLVLYAFALVWSTDSFAYFCGRLLGRRPLGLAASPNKTVEGTLGGLLFGVLVAVALKRIFPIQLGGWTLLSWPVYLPLSLGLAVMAQAGDLMESALKRSSRRKDSGSLIPGHGGLLDVFDAQLVVSPLLYVLVVLFGGQV